MQKASITSLLLVLLFAFFSVGQASGESSERISGIAPSHAADLIHSVIEANRTIYSEVVVERLATTISLKATENWESENTLPLPAQFLALSSRMLKEKGVGMNYRLISLWPINSNNGPKSIFEKAALQKFFNEPTSAQISTSLKNGKKIFTAVYPDLAVVQACVTCHNNHHKSQKRDFKLGDIMGGIVISFPISEFEGNSNAQLISPEVTADYIHSVLESDRTVYSKYIVDRLQNENIVHASENWWDENALPLPAQFLLNASELIFEKRMKFDFKLISLWPINTQNGAANEFERRGLEHVARNPARPFIGTSRFGGKKYFQVVYPDFAVTSACVSCHNAHPKSPKNNFKLNDVMGGIILTILIE